MVVRYRAATKLQQIRDTARSGFIYLIREYRQAMRLRR